MSSNQSNDKFKSRLGIVAATAGSAVGLGNLWGFSYKAGTNGGGNFVLLYLFSVLFIGIPVMLTEFIIGREGRGGPVGSIENIAGSKKSPYVIGGYFGALCTFLILSFYCVIAGWSMSYLLNGLTQGFSQFASIDSSVYFTTITEKLGLQVFFQGLFVVISVVVVTFGIQNGIEKLSKIMMPLLFAIIILLVGYNLTLPGFQESLDFLFKPTAFPEGESIFTVFPAALGQAFFSLSLGMGAIITYARAVDKDENINVITAQVAFCDTAVALLAGLAIFPIIFSAGLSPNAGPGLAFVALPVGFAQMPFGYLFGNLFFLLLIVAALTSSISMLENTCTVVLEKVKIERKLATILVGVAVFLFGLLSQAGIGYSSQFLESITGATTFLDQLDAFTMKYLIPMGALAFSLLVGYRMKPEVIKKQINNDLISKIFIPYVRYVVPVIIAIIFVSGLLA